jgi:hypothetical protein
MEYRDERDEADLPVAAVMARPGHRWRRTAMAEPNPAFARTGYRGKQLLGQRYGLGLVVLTLLADAMSPTARRTASTTAPWA